MDKRQLPDSLARLSEQIARIESGTVKSKGATSSGFPQVDALLPDGGFRSGTLVEWLQAKQANGAITLGLLAAREACRHQGTGKGTCVVVEQRRAFYPPAASALGIATNQLVIVRPENDRDEIWALTQILRCRHVAAVLCSPGNLSSFDFRRLQLAAESGGTLGCLIRSEKALKQPSWAKVRLFVETTPCSSAEVQDTAGMRSRELFVKVLNARPRGDRTVKLRLAAGKDVNMNQPYNATSNVG